MRSFSPKPQGSNGFSQVRTGGSCITYLDIALLIKYNCEEEVEPEKDSVWNGCA